MLAPLTSVPVDALPDSEAPAPAPGRLPEAVLLVRAAAGPVMVRLRVAPSVLVHFQYEGLHMPPGGGAMAVRWCGGGGAVAFPMVYYPTTTSKHMIRERGALYKV